MKKVWTSLLVTTLATSALAGCASNNNGSVASPTASSAAPVSSASTNGEVQEIHVFHFMVEISEQFNAMTEEFSKKYPNIKIVNDIVGGSTDWKSDLKTRFAAGDGPDVFAVDGPSMLKLWQSRIADLSNEPWVGNALPFAKEAASIDGKLYGMPYNLQGFGLVYNKDHFAKAGITQTPKTLTELRDAAEKLKKAGITPFGNGYGEWWIFGMHQMNIPFAQQPDPDQFIQDLSDGKATIKGNALFEDYKNFLDLTLKYGNDNPITTDYKTQETLFAGGQVAMIHQGDWAEAPMRQMNPDMGNIGLMPLPINDDAEKMDRLEVGLPLFWALNKESKHLEAAKTFMNWMVTSDAGKKYLTEQFKYIPAYNNIEATSLGALSQVVLEYSKANKTIPWNFSSWPDGATNEFHASMQAYVAGKLKYDEALAKMDEAWKDLYKK
ncbi:ABC transporter substrate-binding protein [Paenibacillus hexagrammi]|uniref:Extracellular solute-binding protein n=1 Tax=Paenibacillus hexagrammi TaxID=2908839 RepID=A0ABY3SLD3_9BACL|nr:extracellular solute-binding protein [Paenibacillus sp. YPD9-1]UJF33996.1 extracellular solute-binding protein [Paenibacillus sp. YPD9-1]